MIQQSPLAAGSNTRNAIQCGAVHPLGPPCPVRADGEAVELALGGLPLGLFDNGVYKSESIEFEPGDLICIYSDGITESTSPRDEELGLPRFVELLQSVHEEPLPDIVKSIDRAVSEFAAGVNQADDQTLVLIRRTP